MRLPMRFCEDGETDIFFYKDHKCFHIIDRGIRLSGGCEVSDRNAKTLTNAYATTWVQWHGPFQILYSDGEKGFDNAEPHAELKRLGT